MNNDTDLIERARNGDKAAFKELVVKHKKNVYYLAYDLTRCREDAEDVSQDVFVKVYNSLKKFRGDSKFSSWLYRITVNTCYSLKRKKNYSAMKTSEDIENLNDSNYGINSLNDISPEKQTESGFIKANIEHALQKLPQKERTIFIMRNYSGMPFNEIVEILNLKPGTVRSANFKALKKLRKALVIYKDHI